MNRRYLMLWLALSAFLLDDHRLLGQLAPQDEKASNIRRRDSAESTKFLRLVKDDAGAPASLDTSITRYVSEDKKLLVDLIAVIHIGEGRYYRRLNHQFEQYDSLLYELVAAKNQIPSRDRGPSNNPIQWLQSSMQQMLGLESQLQHIDYRSSNFVHADLTPRQMQQKMAERGETVWSLGFNAINEMMQQRPQDRGGDAATGPPVQSLEDLFDLLGDPVKLKIVLAEQFAAEGGLETGLGESLNRLLVTDRNQAAMNVLNQEIARGQTKIGIFYGAAHMPDFEKRLLSQMGFKKTKQAWVQAWDLQAAPQRDRTDDVWSEMLLQLMKSLDN